MLTIKERPDGLLQIYADGRLTTDDYDGFIPQFDADRTRTRFRRLGRGEFLA